MVVYDFTEQAYRCTDCDPKVVKTMPNRPSADLLRPVTSERFMRLEADYLNLLGRVQVLEQKLAKGRAVVTFDSV